MTRFHPLADMEDSRGHPGDPGYYSDSGTRSRLQTGDKTESKNGLEQEGVQTEVRRWEASQRV